MRLIFRFRLQSRLRRLLIFSCRIVVMSLPRLLRPASFPRLLSLGGIWSTPWRMTPPLAGLRRSLDRALRQLLRRPWLRSFTGSCSDRSCAPAAPCGTRVPFRLQSSPASSAHQRSAAASTIVHDYLAVPDPSGAGSPVLAPSGCSAPAPGSTSSCCDEGADWLSSRAC